MQNIVYIVIFCLIFKLSTTGAFQNNWSYTKDVKSEFSGKLCQYRNFNPYPYEFFNDIGGFACYDYSNPDMIKNKILYYNVRKYYPNLNRYYNLPGGLFDKNDNTSVFSFDYKNETVKQFVAESFVSDKFYQKWLLCSQRAEECCENSMTNENILPNKENDTCPVVWDGWDCFNAIPANTKAENYCPNYVTMGDPPCRLTSIKECFSNGTWNEKTDYTTCYYGSIVSDRTVYHSYALFVANLLCLPAIIIFFAFPALRITRVILHRNLLVVIVIKNILVIMSKTLITLRTLEDKEFMEENGVPCRMLAFFERVAINAMYACMLVDGFYLHKIIVAVFRKDPPIYLFYLTVAVLSLGPILVWTGLKVGLDNTNCWVVDNSWHYWIIDGSRYAMLGVNLLLLLDIIRVLVWKLQRNNGSQHTKYYYVSIHGIRSFRYVVLRALTATLRATFILLPLFGLQFIMMSQRPVNAPCLWDNVFYYVSYTIDASQGVLVSVLYCYFNKEVQTLLKRSYQKFMTGFNARRPTLNLRRSTTATYVSDNQNAPRESKSKFKGKNLEPIAEEEINQNVKVQSWMQNNFSNS